MQSTLDRQGALGIAELLVLWQNPDTRAMIPVAVLSYDGSTYAFRYFEAASKLEGFRPFLGFRDLEKTYRSDTLFPLFRERALDPARPDFQRYVESIDLDVESASPWEILVHSGGKSEGDTLQLTPFPIDHDGEWQFRFMVAGVRYLREKSVIVGGRELGMYSPDEYEAILSSVRAGDRLIVENEDGNAYAESACVLLTEDDCVVGYLPDWISRLAAEFDFSTSDTRIVVEHSNGSEAGWHLRLLVRMDVAASTGLSTEKVLAVLDTQRTSAR